MTVLARYSSVAQIIQWLLHRKGPFKGFRDPQRVVLGFRVYGQGKLWGLVGFLGIRVFLVGFVQQLWHFHTGILGFLSSIKFPSIPAAAFSLQCLTLKYPCSAQPHSFPAVPNHKYPCSAPEYRCSAQPPATHLRGS